MKTIVFRTLALVFTTGLLSIDATAQIENNLDNPFLNRDYWATQPSIESIKSNMAKGFSVQEANGGGFDATTFAIFANNPVETIKFLVEQGNSVNKRTHDSRTYIFWAASRGNLELMKYFVDQGAIMDLKDSHGYSLLLFTAATGQMDKNIYDFCIANGSDIVNEKDHHGKNILLVMIPRLKDLTMVDYLISKGIKLNSTDDHGNGIFSYAAKGGNIDLLNQLVKRGVNYAANEKTGENAILFASTGREIPLSVYTYLEGLGLTPNVKTVDGTTPLHNLAKASSDLEIYNYFIEKGVAVNQMDSDNNTALINASARNSLDVVSYLIENGSNVNMQNKKGQSALTKAVEGNSPEVVNYLISKSGDVNVIDDSQNSLAYYLVKSYRGDDAQAFDAKKQSLTKAGLNFQALQQDNSTLFHIAIEKNDLFLLQKLNEFGIDVNAKDANGNTALHYAAMKSMDDRILKYLISIGADKKSTTEFGETAFDLASENELLSKNETDLQFLN